MCLVLDCWFCFGSGPTRSQPVATRGYSARQSSRSPGESDPARRHTPSARPRAARVHGEARLAAHYNGRVFAVRYLYVLALVIWLGGMVVLGAVVAPVTFQVLQAQEGMAGRVLAGAVFGTALERFHYVEYLCGGLLIVTSMAMAVVGPRPVAFALRAAIVAGMLGLAVYSGVVVSARIDTLQARIGERVSPSTLAVTDARRIQFDHLHQLSSRIMMINIAGALLLLSWEARE